MKRPGFFEGAGLGLLASVLGSVTFVALRLVFPSETAWALLIALLGLGYTVYLLGRSAERVGRLSTLLFCLIAAGAVWLWSPILPIYLLFYVGLVWLVRSLYFHADLLGALADFGLNGLALATALWAADRTGSLFLSLWCFFLVQALFVAIPAWTRKPGQPAQAGSTEDNFQQAHRAAEAALRRISSQH
jgi:hypothetical protein